MIDVVVRIEKGIVHKVETADPGLRVLVIDGDAEDEEELFEWPQTQPNDFEELIFDSKSENEKENE